MANKFARAVGGRIKLLFRNKTSFRIVNLFRVKTTFLRGINNVILWRSKKQVSRILTWWVIAFMAHKKSFWNRSVNQLPSKPMSSCRLPIVLYSTVTTSDSMFRPNPTRIFSKFFEAHKIPFFRRYSIITKNYMRTSVKFVTDIMLLAKSVSKHSFSATINRTFYWIGIRPSPSHIMFWTKTPPLTFIKTILNRAYHTFISLFSYQYNLSNYGSQVVNYGK